MDDLFKKAARLRSLADAIVVDNPRARAVRSQCDYVIEHHRLKTEGARLGFLLVAPPQSGKSTILLSITHERNTDEALKSRTIPVLFVTISEKATRKQLAQNILEGIERHGYETGAHSGTEADLYRRVRILLRALRVDLLILDEFHHIVHRESKLVAHSVGEAVKVLLISGVCPIVMAGMEDARRPFDANPQLAKRCLAEIELKRLNVLDGSDAELFMAFLEDFLTELENRSIMKNARDLLAGTIPAGILQVTEGVLGDACNLIKHAMDEATWAGRERITPLDLSTAAAKHFKGQHNPFGSTERGVRESRSHVG
jgi:hypothetical protein